MQVKKEWRQVNENYSKGTYRDCRKVQETSSDTGVHITEPLLCYINGECVLKIRDTPTAGNNLFPIAIRPFAMFMCS